MNKGKMVGFAVFGIFFAVVALTIVFSITDDYEDSSFDHYKTDVDIVVHENGGLSVTETYDFRWSEESSGEMYRVFADEAVDAMVLSSIKCFIDGKEAALIGYDDRHGATDDMPLYTYGTDNPSRDWEMNAFYERASSGEHTVVFQYDLNNVVSEYADCVELNYKVFTTFSDDLKDLTVTVTMPAGSQQSDTRIFGHGDPNGYSEFVGGTANAVFKSPNLEAYTMFEIRIVNKQTDLYSISPIKDDKTFDSILAEEDRFFREMEMDILLVNIQIGLIIAMLCISILIPVLRFKLRKRNKPNFKHPYMREIPSVKPNITAELGSYYKLIKEKSGNKITATILNLAVQKVIAIEKGEGKDIVFVSLNNNAPMTRFEKSVYSMLFSGIIGTDDVRISLSQLNKKLSGLTTDTFQLSAADKSEFDSKRYVGNSLNQHYEIWEKTPLIPFAFLFVIFIIAAVTDFSDYVIFGFISAAFSMILLAFTAGKVPAALTVEGEDEYARTQALKRFYTDMTLMKERKAMELPLWEQHLVYATALGVADKVIKELDVRLTELNVSGYQSAYIYNLYSVGGLSSTISSIDKVSNAAFIRHYNIASGNSGNFGNVGRGGGGGGFSGGGGGGFGGGGGGHR